MPPVSQAQHPVVGLLLTKQQTVLDNLERRRKDLERYRFLMAAVGTRDVSSCGEFQRVFNGLYMVRRNSVWRASFYGLLEAYKSTPATYDQVLGDIHRATGRVEASFASKLLATLDPAQPIYDSIVRQQLGLPLRRESLGARIVLLCEDFASIQQTYQATMEGAGFAQLRTGFDERFPEYAGFSDTKKLDFMIWQSLAA